MFDALRRWLDEAPITDPLDRSDPGTIQWLLWCLLVSPVTLLASHLLMAEASSDTRFHIILTGVMALAAGASLACVRRGRLRTAVVLYLCVMLIAAWFNQLHSGLRALVLNHADPILALMLAGLVLGRRALWLTVLLLLLVLLGSGVIDLATQGARAFEHAPSLALAYLGAAIMLDRGVAALHNARRVSATRQRQLLRATTELERLQAELVHARELQASGQIASGVAHDLNNVLNVVLGYAQRRERLADRGMPAVLEALAGVESEVRRALQINRGLLDLGRRQASQAPEAFDLREALGELLPMLRHLFPPAIQVRLEAGDTPLPVRLDRRGFVLMMLNLASNARDAMPQGGCFAVHARGACDARGRHVLLRVSDTGQGIAESIRAQVFERYYTTKITGTGLGLALVRDMLRGAGGGIELDHGDGGGARFLIRLPWWEEEPAPAPGPQPANT